MVRQKIRRRIKELREAGAKAKEENNQQLMLDVMIRVSELTLLLKNL